jgi:outer membrane protein assembly factor BamB
MNGIVQLPRSSRVAVLLIVMFSSAKLMGADWWQFRGPLGNGVAGTADLPVKWDPDTNVRWKIPLAGQGWSSPLIVGGRIYLTAAVPSAGGYSLRALSLEAASGKKAWETKVFVQPGTAPAIHGKNSHASPTPVLVDGRLYVHFGHQGSACLDINGKILWKATGIDYAPVHGNGGSPIVVKGKMIFSVDGAEQTFVVALNCKDGSEAWRHNRQSEAVRKFSFSTPVAVESNGQTQIISPGTDVVHSLDLEDGSVIWYAAYDGYSVIPKPIYGHGMVYMGTGWGTPSVLAISVDGKGDVTDTHVRWRLSRGAPHTPSLLLVEDDLFMVSDRGIASCVDARTGETHWQERIGDAYSASPIYAGGRVYFLSEGGIGTVIAAARQFRSLGVNKMGERTLASYGVTGDALIIRTDKNLYRIEAP